MTHQDAREKRTEAAVAAAAAGHTGFPIAQRVVQAYAFALDGDQAISPAGLDFSDIPPQACMCQLYITLMGVGNASNAYEYSVTTISFAADGGGQTPDDRLTGAEAIQFLEAMDDGSDQRNSAELTALAATPEGEIEIKVGDVGSNGPWKTTALCERTEFILVPA